MLQPDRFRGVARRGARLQKLLGLPDSLSEKIRIDPSERVREASELLVRERQQPRPGRGVAARQVDAGCGDLDERLEEELRVALRFRPERLPLLVRLEEAPGAELPEALREERIGGFDQPRPPETRPSFSRNASTGR